MDAYSLLNAHVKGLIDLLDALNGRNGACSDALIQDIKSGI